MIQANNVHKVFAPASRGATPVVALRDVSFEMEEGEFYVLLGSSGSGKTTMLRSIAGLERPDGGEITIAGQTMFSVSKGIFVPPEDRPIGMVFQSFALWPHMNVSQNIAFPLRYGAKRLRRNEVKGRVQRVIDLLGLSEQAERPVTRLSGGQQQRVALARAVALEPKVLLMDEPLSSLDAKLRTRLRLELKQLTSRLGITTLYVTHDQEEAIAMGDRIAVMDRGSILQEGSPWDLYRRPAHLFVAQFLGEMNFLEGDVESAQDGLAKVITSAGPLQVTLGEASCQSGHVWVGLRWEDLTLADGPGDNVLPGRVAGGHFRGDAFLYSIRVGSDVVQVRRPPSERRLEPEQDVWLRLPAEHALAFHRGEQAQLGQPFESGTVAPDSDLTP